MLTVPDKMYNFALLQGITIYEYPKTGRATDG
jgi:hypothetical protein